MTWLVALLVMLTGGIVEAQEGSLSFSAGVDSSGRAVVYSSQEGRIFIESPGFPGGIEFVVKDPMGAPAAKVYLEYQESGSQVSAFFSGLGEVLPFLFIGKLHDQPTEIVEVRLSSVPQPATPGAKTLYLDRGILEQTHYERAYTFLEPSVAWIKSQFPKSERNIALTMENPNGNRPFQAVVIRVETLSEGKVREFLNYTRPRIVITPYKYWGGEAYNWALPHEWKPFSDNSLFAVCATRWSHPPSGLDGIVRITRNLSHENLHGANLQGLDLSYFNMMGIDLSEAVLSGAKLVEVNFQSANLQNAVLKGADLRRAIIQSRLAGADFGGANLRQAVLNGCALEGVNFQGADLRSVNMEYSILSRQNLRGANLRSANLRGAVLLDADLREADLRHVYLSYAKLDGANLSGAIWIDGHICGPESIGQCK